MRLERIPKKLIDFFDKNTLQLWSEAFNDALDDGAPRRVDWISDPLQDGHPILSKWDKDCGRGVLLQQVSDTADRFWFKCWMSRFEHDETGHALPYLFVETFVSESGRALFLSIWSPNGVSNGLI